MLVNIVDSFVRKKLYLLLTTYYLNFYILTFMVFNINLKAEAFGKQSFAISRFF